MLNSRRLEDLHRIVAEKARRLEIRAARYGIELLIVSTLRDSECQALLYALGRSTPGPLSNSQRELGFTVTQRAPGFSFHEYGCAFDAYPIVAGRLVKSTSPVDWKVWKVLDQLAREPRINLQWGGRLKHGGALRELWHFHYTAGLTIDQLRAGARLPDVDIGTVDRLSSSFKSSAPAATPAAAPSAKAGRRRAKGGRSKRTS